VYLKGSNTQAIGGDLAYRYATMGNDGDLSWQTVSTRLASMSGSGWQTLVAPSSTVNPWTALQAGISLIADQTVGLPSPITPQSPLGAGRTGLCGAECRVREAELAAAAAQRALIAAFATDDMNTTPTPEQPAQLDSAKKELAKLPLLGPVTWLFARDPLRRRPRS
jgi:hypothetical protein